jgi:hypothetical protein
MPYSSEKRVITQPSKDAAIAVVGSWLRYRLSTVVGVTFVRIRERQRRLKTNYGEGSRIDGHIESGVVLQNDCGAYICIDIYGAT